MLLDTDHNSQTGASFLGVLGFDNMIVFENVSGFRAKVYRTPAGVPSTLESSSWTATVNGNSVSSEIPLSSLHNSKELVFVLVSIDEPGGFRDFIPDTSVGIYDDRPGLDHPRDHDHHDPPVNHHDAPPRRRPSTTTTTTSPSTTTTTVPPATFTDVPATHPYYLQINDMAVRHVVDGYGNGLFGPEDWVKRLQFAKMVAVRDGLPGERG